MNIALASQYILDHRAYQEASVALKLRKEAMEVLEKQLIDEFAQAGVQSIRTDNGLVYLNRNIYARLCVPVSTLQETEWAWLVEPKVNHNTLSATVRELPRDENDQPILPEEVKDKVLVDEVFRLGVRA